MRWYAWLILAYAEVAVAVYVKQAHTVSMNRDVFLGETRRERAHRVFRMVTDSVGWFGWVLYHGITQVWRDVVG